MASRIPHSLRKKIQDHTVGAVQTMNGLPSCVALARGGNRGPWAGPCCTDRTGEVERRRTVPAVPSAGQDSDGIRQPRANQGTSPSRRDERHLLRGTDPHASVLDHSEDDLEPELLTRDRPERLEGVRPEGVELRGRVEIGDRRLTVEHALALVHAEAERTDQVVAPRSGRGFDGAIAEVDRGLLSARY